MPEYYENIIKHYDLYKSYGEFNFLFEDTIQEYRMLTIAIVRISYEYYEEEDQEQNEFPYNQQDRLLKIIMNNMGAREIIESCRACFIDFFKEQKQKFGSYTFKWSDDERIISETTFNYIIEIFKKCLQLIELRNTIIHSHYSESLSIPERRRENLKGRKEFKTGKGYELRNFSFDTNMLEKINSDVQVLQQYLNGIRFMFYLEDQQKDNYAEELSYLKRMDFDVNFSVDK